MTAVRRWSLWTAATVVAAAAVMLVDVSTTRPRVTVRWHPGVAPQARGTLEQRYGLRGGEPLGGSTWRYELRDRSSVNIEALVRDPAVDDTGYIDRDRLTAEAPRVTVGLRAPSELWPWGEDDRFRARSLVQVQTLLLLGAGGCLLLASRAREWRRRRAATTAILIGVGALAWALPISASLVRMGDATYFTDSRENFESIAGVSRIRFEAHLSYAVLGQVYKRLPATADAPFHAQMTLARAATAWFVAWALVLAVLERWSPVVIRYLALAVLAPSALLYFGWREFGYLSLNLAALPLVIHGMHVRDGRLELGSVLAGLGAAFHGFGLVALAGAAAAAIAASGPQAARLDRTLRVLAWGTAAYLGWIAIYVIVLHVPVVAGHAQGIPWRPWLVDTAGDGRLNVAILSAAGAGDVLMTAWVVGAPLLMVTASMRRMVGEEARMALACAVPSVAFTICFWPIQGLAEEMDLIVASFPAVYGLAWVCAHEVSKARLAAGLLASAHVAFWLMLFHPRFAGRLVAG